MGLKVKGVSSREVIAELEADGWVAQNAEGSHHIFKHPTKTGRLSVPHPKKDIGEGLVRKLYRRAGLL